MKIITVSREFGSGGRELGKRLADTLGIAYFDREIIAALTDKCEQDERFIERTESQAVLSAYPITISRTLSRAPVAAASAAGLLFRQHSVIRELAHKGDCVIVGRCADVVLEKYHPLRLFVYADMPAKITRCRGRGADVEPLTDRELERKIRQVDKARADHYALISQTAWGDKHAYQLCVNTTGMRIRDITPMLATFAQHYC